MMGKKSKTKSREMVREQQICPFAQQTELDTMVVTPSTTTQTPMSYATAVKNSETETTSNSDPNPPLTTVFGGMETQDDGSHTIQHLVSPHKIGGNGIVHLGDFTLPRSPSPNSDPLMQIRESLKDFELPALTESSESDGESHLSMFTMSIDRNAKAELLAQDKYIRRSNNYLTNVSAGMTKTISTLHTAISETEDNLRSVRRTARRLDNEVHDPSTQMMMHADLMDVMIKSFTRLLHGFGTQVRKLETHLATINQTLRLVPKNKLQFDAAGRPTGRKNRRRKHKGRSQDDKQLRDPATSTHPTDEGLLMTRN